MTRKISLVLSGGGARGIAHIGVIDELLANDFEIVSIAGTSMGALVGGIYANGKLNELRDWLINLDKRKVFSLVDFTFSRTGLIKGEKVINALKEFIPDVMIENLDIPFTATAVDLNSRKEYVFRKGSLFDAIRSSISIPSVFMPVKMGDALLVDGGVMNNLPISNLIEREHDYLVTSNVNAICPLIKSMMSAKEKKKNKENYLSKIGFFNERIRQIHPKDGHDHLGYFDIMSQTLSLMMNQITACTLKQYKPDFLINISRDSCGTYDFYKAPELYEIGRLATRQKLNLKQADTGSFKY